MFLVEKNLKQSILRKNILKELNSILNNTAFKQISLKQEILKELNFILNNSKGLLSENISYEYQKKYSYLGSTLDEVLNKLSSYPGWKYRPDEKEKKDLQYSIEEDSFILTDNECSVFAKVFLKLTNKVKQSGFGSLSIEQQKTYVSLYSTEKIFKKYLNYFGIGFKSIEEIFQFKKLNPKDFDLEGAIRNYFNGLPYNKEFEEYLSKNSNLCAIYPEIFFTNSKGEKCSKFHVIRGIKGPQCMGNTEGLGCAESTGSRLIANTPELQATSNFQTALYGSPEQQTYERPIDYHRSEFVDNLLTNIGKNFYEAWQELKSGVKDPSLFSKAGSLAWQDVKVLAEKDPASLICWALDLVSLIDPTGIADITQGQILIMQGIAEGSGLSIFFGIICIIAGVMTFSAFTAATGTVGEALPLLALAKTSAISLKQISRKSVIAFIDFLKGPGGDTIVSTLKVSKGLDLKVTRKLEQMVQASKNIPISSEEKSAKELLEQLTGEKVAESAISPLSASGKQEITNAAELARAGKLQLLGFAASTGATSKQASEIANVEKSKLTAADVTQAISFMKNIRCKTSLMNRLCKNVDIINTFKDKLMYTKTYTIEEVINNLRFIWINKEEPVDDDDIGAYISVFKVVLQKVKTN